MTTFCNFERNLKMKLTLDIGNTNSKLAVFEGDGIVHHDTIKMVTEDRLNTVFGQYSITGAIVSSVKDDSTIKKLLKKHNFFELSSRTPLPLENVYRTPESLGLDRIAAVVAAHKGYGEEGAVLVIDVGTCITYDIVASGGRYLGGGISPGIAMRLKALHENTGKLPLVDPINGEVKLIGNSTITSILSGVYNGVKHELEGTIKAYEQQYNDLKIVLTGGDRKRFELVSKNRIFADEFLVLKGLKEILNYNEKN